MPNRPTTTRSRGASAKSTGELPSPVEMPSAADMAGLSWLFRGLRRVRRFVKGAVPVAPPSRATAKTMWLGALATVLTLVLLAAAAGAALLLAAAAGLLAMVLTLAVFALNITGHRAPAAVAGRRAPAAPWRR